MYAIQDIHGKWWTGKCWGVEQAREVYRTRSDLPAELCDADDNMEIVNGDRYWVGGMMGYMALARVVRNNDLLDEIKNSTEDQLEELDIDLDISRRNENYETTARRLRGDSRDIEADVYEAMDRRWRRLEKNNG